MVLSVFRSRLFAILLGVLILCSIAASATEPDPHYWRLADIQAQFDIWEAQYPDIFHQTTIGTSGRRVDIPMVRISDNAAISEAEPRMLFHGALHSNEPNGTTAIMKSMEALLLGYGKNPATTARVDSLEIFFVPILNVDGHHHVFSGDVAWADWRKTLRDNNQNGEVDFPADGVDLNRNWDWNWDEYDEDNSSSLKYKGPFPFSEPEIAAVRDFILQQRPVVVVDYHSPVTISWRSYIFWPWVDNGGGGMGPDAAVSEDVAELWAGATLNEDGNPYHDIYAYSTLPKEQCWVYGRTGILAYIMEISDHCWWSGAQVDTVGARVARGSNALVDRVLEGPGIRGQVRDEGTGEALVAEVKIDEMHSDLVGPRLTEAGHGMYHRLTTAGSYTVTASCEGYFPQTQCVSVASSWEQLDFDLVASTSGVGPAIEYPWLATAHVLGSDHSVRLEMPAGLPSATVELFDLRGHRVGILGGDLESGRTHDLKLPDQISGGVYLVRVVAGDQRQTGRVTVVR